MPRIVIIGGGISGLACARELLDSPAGGALEVTVLEASAHTGGPVRSECLTFALSMSGLCGVWGGLSAEQRRALSFGRAA